MQTKKAVHLLVMSQKDGVVQTLLERKIPLITIKSVSMSTMRDDWLVNLLCILPDYKLIIDLGVECWQR